MEKEQNRESTFINIFVIVCIIYIFISEVFQKYSNIFRYSDEIITLSIVIVILILGMKNKILIDKNDLKILKALIYIVLIGVIFNYIFELQTSIKVILLDMYSVTKSFIVFIGLRILLNKSSYEKILKFFYIPSKLFLILATIFGALSLFMNLGMSGEFRYGIPSFRFIFEYEHSFAVVVIVCLAIIMYNRENCKFYMILAIICQILTTKGPSIIWTFMIIFFINYFKRNEKIRPKVWMILGIMCLALGSFQINTYLTNENAPRYLFFKYGMITALNYFPLGSGFSTFGSDMAAKYYSILYKKYGFDNLYGMNHINGMFLNDTYWPMIIGQFGFIGVFIFLYIFKKIYDELGKSRNCHNLKALNISFFFYIIIHSIGSSIITSSMGVFAFMILAILTKVKGGKKIEKN